MKNNVKVERLFEGGPIDLFEVTSFLGWWNWEL